MDVQPVLRFGLVCRLAAGRPCRARRRGTLPPADRANADDAVPGQPWPTTPTYGPATGVVRHPEIVAHSPRRASLSAPHPAGMPGAPLYAEAFHRCPAAASDWCQSAWQSTRQHLTALRRSSWIRPPDSSCTNSTLAHWVDVSTSLRIWRLGFESPRGAPNAQVKPYRGLTARLAEAAVNDLPDPAFDQVYPPSRSGRRQRFSSCSRCWLGHDATPASRQPLWGVVRPRRVVRFTRFDSTARPRPWAGLRPAPPSAAIPA